MTWLVLVMPGLLWLAFTLGRLYEVRRGKDVEAMVGRRKYCEPFEGMERRQHRSLPRP
jgi:hypothetical protein